ncbi:MAG TPA: CSLREA domain-containing protein [Roseiflexaceae bacterium]|nr:CSLREA domain-containing protein [Roseiflexaceae bacterium]
MSKTADTADGTCDSDCSLREAIIAANTNPDADTITLSAKTYALTLGGADENSSATGDLDIAEDLTINGAGAGQTVIKGGAGWDDRIFDVVSYGAAVAFHGVTITKGNASGGGGGISNIGTLALNNSSISGNTSSYVGGGISNSSGGTLELDNSIVSGNAAGAGGGISSVNAAVLLTNSAVSGNTTSNSGGGTSSLNSTLTVNNSTISGNTSTGDYGGGISSGDGTLTVNNSTISGNSAHLGAGGIKNLGGTLTLANSTISGNNTTSGTGGGIINFGALGPYTAGTAILNNVTIANNSAPGGGGIANGGTFKLKNSLIAGNSTGSTPDCSGTLASEGYNLLGNSAGCGGLTDGVSGDRVGSAAHPLDPKLGPLQDNGGATFTHALLSISSALDAGSPATCGAADQRGVARPQGLGCDIGAYEFDGSMKQNQTISFAPLPNKAVGDAPFAIGATASSGLKVTFTAGGQCKISGGLVTLTGAGSCTITAHQAGDASYNPAADVARSFLISGSAQSGGFTLYLPLVVR